MLLIWRRYDLNPNSALAGRVRQKNPKSLAPPPSPTHKTLTSSKRKAATTPTTTPPSTKYQTTNQKTNWSHVLAAQCAQPTTRTTCWQQRESRRGSSARAVYISNTQNDRQTPRRPLGKTHLQLEPERYPPSRKSTGSKEDWPKDGKTTSAHTHNQPESTETTAISRATRLGLQDGSKWDSMESDFVSSRHKQPTRHTIHFTTTTTNKPTTRDQTAQANEAYDQDEGSTDDDDDTLLLLSQTIERYSATAKQPQHANQQKTRISASATHSIASEPHFFVQRRYRPTSF